MGISLRVEMHETEESFRERREGPGVAGFIGGKFDENPEGIFRKLKAAGGDSALGFAEAVGNGKGEEMLREAIARKAAKALLGRVMGKK